MHADARIALLHRVWLMITQWVLKITRPGGHALHDYDVTGPFESFAAAMKWSEEHVYTQREIVPVISPEDWGFSYDKGHPRNKEQG
jgi:hypothetical protein